MGQTFFIYPRHTTAIGCFIRHVTHLDKKRYLIIRRWKHFASSAFFFKPLFGNFDAGFTDSSLIWKVIIITIAGWFFVFFYGRLGQFSSFEPIRSFRDLEQIFCRIGQWEVLDLEVLVTRLHIQNFGFCDQLVKHLAPLSLSVLFVLHFVVILTLHILHHYVSASRRNIDDSFAVWWTRVQERWNLSGHVDLALPKVHELLG